MIRPSCRWGHFPVAVAGEARPTIARRRTAPCKNLNGGFPPAIVEPTMSRPQFTPHALAMQVKRDGEDQQFVTRCYLQLALDRGQLISDGLHRPAELVRNVLVIWIVGVER